METISIDFRIPASWSELSDKQLRTVYQLIADDMSTQHSFEIKPEYLQKLLAKRWNGKVKIITGIRRCGKSFLLSTLFKNHLISEGVSAEDFIEIALDRKLEQHGTIASVSLSRWTRSGDVPTLTR